jgi:hypothetical protein
MWGGGYRYNGRVSDTRQRFEKVVDFSEFPCNSPMSCSVCSDVFSKPSNFKSRNGSPSVSTHVNINQMTKAYLFASTSFIYAFAAGDSTHFRK